MKTRNLKVFLLLLLLLCYFVTNIGDNEYIHQENVYFSPNLDGPSEPKNEYLESLEEKLSDIQVQDYFKDSENTENEVKEELKINNFDKLF